MQHGLAPKVNSAHRFGGVHGWLICERKDSLPTAPGGVESHRPPCAAAAASNFLCSLLQGRSIEHLLLDRPS